MIEAFDVAGYRCFRDRQTLKLGRLTLIYGKNNTGKSALIRLPALIAGSLSGHPGLNLTHPAVNHASFSELVWRKGMQGDLLELGVTFDGRRRWAWALEWREQLRQGTPVKIWFPGTKDPWSWKPPTRDEVGMERTFAKGDHMATIQLQGLRPEGRIVPDGLVAALKDVRWLCALRAGPRRDGIPDGLRPPFSSLGGEWAEASIQDPAILEGTSRWFHQHTGHAIVIDNIDGRSRIRLQLANGAAPNVPFPDVGEGLQQVFPVVVALENLRATGGLLCIEEPEAHLHPGLQRALARQMSSVLQANPNAQILLETHSEPFLYEALLAAVTDLPGAVFLHSTKNDQDGASTLHEIELDRKGRPLDDTLRQTFDEVGKLRREVIEARRAYEG